MNNDDKDAWRVLLACAAGVCIGNAGWWNQPALIAQRVGNVGLEASTAGLVASAELAALAALALWPFYAVIGT